MRGQSHSIRFGLAAARGGGGQSLGRSQASRVPSTSPPPRNPLSTISYWRCLCHPFLLPQLFAGVDIAATSFMAAWARPVRPSPRRAPSSNPPEGFAAFHKQLAATGVAPAATLVVLEATGSYWVALAVTLHSAGYHVTVVNPAHVYNDAKSLPRRGKTDGLDARLLTQFGLERQPEPWRPPPLVSHELRQRLVARDGLLTMRQQARNQLPCAGAVAGSGRRRAAADGRR